MAGGLYMLGAGEPFTPSQAQVMAQKASGDGLKNLYVVARVDRVDGETLRRKLAEAKQSGAIAPAVMFAVDKAPKFAIDTTIPIAEKELREYGIFAKLSTADVPPALGGKRVSEFVPGFVVGGGVVAVVAAVGWASWKLVLKRIFT